jgi:hypothetical protein
MCVVLLSVRPHHPQVRAGNLFRYDGVMFLLIQRGSSYFGGVCGTVMFSDRPTLLEAHSTLFVLDSYVVCL